MKKTSHYTEQLLLGGGGTVGAPRRAQREGKPHRRRIIAEEKAKVVAAVWGTEFLKFLKYTMLATKEYLWIKNLQQTPSSLLNLSFALESQKL